MERCRQRTNHSVVSKSSQKRDTAMMKFEKIKNTYYATNSVKPVCITQSVLTEKWVVMCDYGTLSDEAPVDKVFMEFDYAVKWAEAEVGVMIEFAE